jgi:phasin
MSDDAFVKPEVPEAVRDLMKMSIEQAKRAFDTFVSTSEKTWRSLENTSQSTRAGLQTLNSKIAEITRANVEANFALAMKLAESKDVSQAMEFQSQHVRHQMEQFVQQLEEMRDLAAQIIQDSGTAATSIGKQATQDIAKAASSASDAAQRFAASPFKRDPSRSF